MKEREHSRKAKNYNKLAIMSILSFISMYILMYSMVDKFENVFVNINQFYMAALMVAPMMIIELLLMRMMYNDMKLNAILISISAITLVGFYFAIRVQAGVSDRQFLKSMIPHHSGAILMCEQADLTDPELKQLCEEIVANQQKEIAEMKAKLEELD